MPSFDRIFSIEDLKLRLSAPDDNLLRVMALADAHVNYRFGKFVTAVGHLDTYRKKSGFPLSIDPSAGAEDFRHQIRLLHAALLDIAEEQKNLTEPNTLLLRLVVALLEYAQQQRSSELYPRIAPAVHQTLTAFLNHAAKVHLKTTLPDALDTIGRADLRAYCHAAWGELEAEDQSSLKEFLSAWLQYILLRLRFWKRSQ